MAARSAVAAGEPAAEGDVADAAPLEAALEAAMAAMRVGDEVAVSSLLPHGASKSSLKLLAAIHNDDVDSAR